VIIVLFLLVSFRKEDAKWLDFWGYRGDPELWKFYNLWVVLGLEGKIFLLYVLYKRE
jgi:hypothetical protein